VSGTDGGCAKAYNGPVGLLAHFGLSDGSVALAADGGLIIRTLDPNALGLKLGIRGRKLSGKLAIDFAPNVYVGLTKRDEGNKEILSVPVTLGFMASDKLMAGVQTGITGPLDGFGDGYSIRIAIGSMFAATPNVVVGGSCNLFRVAGFEGPGAADLRGLTIDVAYHN